MLFFQGDYGYTIGANLDRTHTLLGYTQHDGSNNGLTENGKQERFSLLHNGENIYGGPVGPEMMSNTTSGLHRRLNGHMAHASFENPVDLSSSKLVDVNGLVKSEGNQCNAYGAHNVVTSSVSVGIPNQHHGKIKSKICV